MRIGILFNNVSPAAGGGFVFEYEMFKALQQMAHKSKHSFVVFCRERDNKLCEKFIGDKITVVNIKQTIFDYIFNKLSNSYFGKDMQKIFRIRERNPFTGILTKNKIDFMWFAIPTRIRPIDIPYAITIWDLQHRLQPWFPEVSSNNEWLRRENLFSTMLRRAAFIITGNLQGKEEIIRFFQIPPERIKVLPLPTPLFLHNAEVDTKKICAKYGIAEEFIFYPAQLWPHKNHYVILKALCYLRDEFGIKIPAVFCGSDMGNLSYLKKLVLEYKLQDLVKFLGFIPREELAALYKSAFALVFPSYFGPDNLPPLEAFALECPVIAAKVSGVIEQLGDAALFFNPKDHIQLAALIKEVRENKALCSELVSRGKKCAGKWNTNDFIEEVFVMFDEFEPIRNCWPSGNTIV